MNILSKTLLIVTGCLLSAGAVFGYNMGPYEGLFKDVSIGHWAVLPIEGMAWIGIMKGPADKPGYFEPEAVVTRAQLAVVAARLNDRIESLESELRALQEQMQSSSSSARNSQRRSDVNTILNAIYQYAIDHNGQIPTSIPSVEHEICQSGEEDCSGFVNLSQLQGTYLVKLPADPHAKGKGTGYTVKRDASGRVSVFAPKAEEGNTISVTR